MTSSRAVRVESFDQITEQRWSLLVRAVIGGLLVVESAVMLVVAMFSAMLGSFVSALAFVAGAGGATEERINETFAVIALTLASPFVVAGVLGSGGVFLLARRRQSLIVATGVVAIAAQIAFHPLCSVRFHALELFPAAVHLLAIAAAVAFVPRTTAHIATF